MGAFIDRVLLDPAAGSSQASQLGALAVASLIDARITSS